MRSPLILVVDDDLDIRNVIANILECVGYAVVTAANGREALEYLRRAELPTVILLDLMMPTMNGWEFRAEQLEDPRLSSIPVIVLTGGRPCENAEHLRATSYVQKPIQLERLLSLVKAAAAIGASGGEHLGL